jgi:hypothetical protein
MAWLLERGTLGYFTPTLFLLLFGESASGTGERWRSISSGGVISSGSVLSKEVSEPAEHLYDLDGRMNFGLEGVGTGRRRGGAIMLAGGVRASALA